MPGNDGVFSNSGPTSVNVRRCLPLLGRLASSTFAQSKCVSLSAEILTRESMSRRRSRCEDASPAPLGTSRPRPLPIFGLLQIEGLVGGRLEVARACAVAVAGPGASFCSETSTGTPPPMFDSDVKLVRPPGAWERPSVDSGMPRWIDVCDGLSVDLHRWRDGGIER